MERRRSAGAVTRGVRPALAVALLAGALAACTSTRTVFDPAREARPRIGAGQPAPPRPAPPRPPAPPASGEMPAVELPPRAAWRWPIDGPVTSRFGTREHGAWHNGLDIGAREGTAVLAALDGEVSFAGTQGNFGRLVVLDHGRGLTTWYAHLKSFEVQRGQKVRQGERVAESGSSGNARGPHLHFEVRRDGKPLDPLVVLP